MERVERIQLEARVAGLAREVGGLLREAARLVQVRVARGEVRFRERERRPIPWIRERLAIRVREVLRRAVRLAGAREHQADAQMDARDLSRVSRLGQQRLEKVCRGAQVAAHLPACSSAARRCPAAASGSSTTSARSAARTA